MLFSLSYNFTQNMDDFFSELDNALEQSGVSKDVSKKDTVTPTPAKSDAVKKPLHNKTVEQKSTAHKKPVHKNKKPTHNHKGQKAQKKGSQQREIRGKFFSKFPETRFYLPSLRKGYTRYMPVG